MVDLAQQTLIVVKPDGVRRGLVGDIIGRFERRGFKLVKVKMVQMDVKKAENFYQPHEGKPFFEELIQFITSGPVLAAVLEGNQAVEVTRRMVGATKAAEAGPGSIRGDFALGVTDNIIHASDSSESFQRESKIIFGEE